MISLWLPRSGAPVGAPAGDVAGDEASVLVLSVWL